MPTRRARVGRPTVGHQMPSLPKTSPSCESAKTGPSRHTKQAAGLAVPAQADAALHVPLERDEDAVGREAALLEGPHGRLHHPLRAAHEGERARAVPGRPVEQVGDDADGSGPAGLAERSTVSWTSMSPRAAQRAQLLAVQLVGRGPGAVVEADRVEPVALGEQPVDERPQRREADAAGDDDHVVAHRPLDRPGRAERTAQADLVAAARGR